MARETRATSAGAGSGRAKSVIASLRSVYRSRCRWDGSLRRGKERQRDNCHLLVLEIICF